MVCIKSVFYRLKFRDLLFFSRLPSVRNRFIHWLWTFIWPETPRMETAFGSLHILAMSLFLDIGWLAGCWIVCFYGFISLNRIISMIVKTEVPLRRHNFRIFSENFRKMKFLRWLMQYSIIFQLIKVQVHTVFLSLFNSHGNIKICWFFFICEFFSSHSFFVDYFIILYFY